MFSEWIQKKTRFPHSPTNKLRRRSNVLGKSVCIVRRRPGQYLDKILKANTPKVNFELRFLWLILIWVYVVVMSTLDQGVLQEISTNTRTSSNIMSANVTTGRLELALPLVGVRITQSLHNAMINVMGSFFLTFFRFLW